MCVCVCMLVLRGCVPVADQRPQEPSGLHCFLYFQVRVHFNCVRLHICVRVRVCVPVCVCFVMVLTHLPCLPAAVCLKAQLCVSTP